jgi:hypothetical protein
MKTRSEAKKPKEEVPAPTESSANLDEVVGRETNPFNFESANARRGAKMRDDFSKITETVFVTDLHETWKKLREALTVGEKRSDHGTLQTALDRAERNAHDAHRLYVTAKIAFDEWDAENASVVGAMWSEATRSLQQEKDQGLRAKQITDGDIKARAATLFPDQWKSNEVSKAKYKATVDSLSNLSEQWNSRCRTLQTMMGKLR